MTAPWSDLDTRLARLLAERGMFAPDTIRRLHAEASAAQRAHGGSFVLGGAVARGLIPVAQADALLGVARDGGSSSHLIRPAGQAGPASASGLGASSDSLQGSSGGAPSWFGSSSAGDSLVGAGPMAGSTLGGAPPPRPRPDAGSTLPDEDTRPTSRLGKGAGSTLADEDTRPTSRLSAGWRMRC